MGEPRDTFKYHLRRSNRLVPQHPYGVTNDLERREQELRQEFPGARIEKVGIKTTRDGALEWERKQYKRKGGKG